MTDSNRARPSSAGLTRDKLLLGVIAVLLLIIAAFYLWKVLAVRGAENRLDEARVEWRAETRRAIDARTTQLLRLSALPLGFAVREAVLAGDLGAVDVYLDRLVSEPGVEGGVFADTAGTIRVATDRALVGRPIGEAYPRLELDRDRPQVFTQADRYHVVVPIMGLNERLGVLVLSYTPERAAPETAGR